jgi:hypothetical protein
VTVASPSDRFRARWFPVARNDLIFGITVLVAYGVAAFLSTLLDPTTPDRLMFVAERALGGHLDSNSLKSTVDTVDVGGHYFLAVGPLQLIAYLPLAAVPALQGIGRYVACLCFGIPAAWLSLPLARAFGAKGGDAFQIAIFTAFGSLLFYVSVLGDFYYLAHAESFLAVTLFLLEWAGRRRPLALGAMLAVSLLARPTTVLAAIPFGLWLIWSHRSDVRMTVRNAVAFGAPITVALIIFGWYNWARFGSPLETGYAISSLLEPSLEARRALGVFSFQQVPENLRLALLALPASPGVFPFVGVSRYGMSMLLVSPALLTSAWAGFRDRTAQLLWTAAVLVALPVFLYYGGGYVQYGFRYSLDFTPFLVALIAIGSKRWIGRPERLLVFASVVSVCYGIVYGIGWHGV